MPGANEDSMEFVSQEELDRLLEDGGEVPLESEPLSGEPEKESSFHEKDQGPQPQVIDSDSASAQEERRLGSGEPAEEPIADRVILEDVPEKSAPPSPARKHRWAPGKGFWIAASMVVVFGTAANVFLWMGSRESLKPAGANIMTFPVVKTPDVQPPSMIRISPLAVGLKGFLIAAPSGRKDLTYISVDVTIELTNAKAASLIKAHTPFYRNIIYEAISGFLQSIDKAKLNEIGLKMVILKAVNGSFPERSVRDVVVDAFVMF